ncbi:carbohydrate ABC transporter substrate-binding protein, partial [Klebsiella oxytoca]
AKDLEQFAGHYMESHPDVNIETVVIEPANYVTKVQTALNGGQKEPDIIVGEPQMLEDFYDAGYFEDLNQ